ncbi:MAG: hypothetical protein QG571_1324, partial [Pseudomonadota bacterium]|nr:hypothetical protein [Pseudomonadota bacterium]
MAMTMPTIEQHDALPSLLERTAKGESFEITKQGQPVGRIVPPETA